MKNILILLLLTAVLVSGCVQQPPTQITGEVPAGAKVVEITAEGFSPAELRISAGETVAWVNKDTVNHWPASAMHPTHAVYPETGGCIGSKFDACAPMEPGKVFAFTFNEKGEWQYHDHLNCCIDTRFFGKIIVE